MSKIVFDSTFLGHTLYQHIIRSGTLPVPHQVRCFNSTLSDQTSLGWIHYQYIRSDTLPAHFRSFTLLIASSGQTLHQYIIRFYNLPVHHWVRYFTSTSSGQKFSQYIISSDTLPLHHWVDICQCIIRSNNH